MQINPIAEIFKKEALHYAVACLYSKLYKTDDFTLWKTHKEILREINCLKIVDSAFRTSCSEKEVDCAVGQLIQASDLDRAMCEKIKSSRGLRQIILGGFHDAGVANAQAVGSDFVLTLDLDECETKDNVCYRKVARITFTNVSGCSVKDDETTIIGFYVSRHREEIIDGKIRFAFEMWNDSDNMLPLILCCDDVTVEYSLVNV